MDLETARQMIAEHMEHELTDEIFEAARRIGLLEGVDDQVTLEEVAADLDRKIGFLINRQGSPEHESAFSVGRDETASIQAQPGSETNLFSSFLATLANYEAVYERAMTTLLADEVIQAEAWLRDFRQQHLEDKSLEVQEIGTWIADHLAEGEHVADANGTDLAASATELLGYPVQMRESNGGDEIIESGLIQTIGGSVLDELCKLNRHLCDRYGWRDVDTTAFILTDRPPAYEEFRATIDTRSPIPVAWKITLEVSPMLPPDEVARRYQEARSRTFGAETRRARRPGQKRVALALFDAMYWRDQGGTWKQKLSDWNFFCTYLNLRGFDEDWRYRWESNLRRDVPKARQDLLHPLYLTRPIADTSSASSPNTEVKIEEGS